MKGSNLKENPQKQAVFVCFMHGNTHLSERPKKARYPAICVAGNEVRWDALTDYKEGA